MSTEADRGPRTDSSPVADSFWLETCRQCLQASDLESALHMFKRLAGASFDFSHTHRFGPASEFRSDLRGSATSSFLHDNRFWEVQLAGSEPALQVGRLLVEAFAKIAGQAWVDAVTGLPNRRHFESVMSWFGANNPPEPFTHLGFFDMDGLGELNRRAGYPQGDIALRSLGSAISAQLARREMVWRYGGDEFVVVCGEESKERLLAPSFRENPPAFKVGWANSLEAAEAAMRSSN